MKGTVYIYEKYGKDPFELTSGGGYAMSDCLLGGRDYSDRRREHTRVVIRVTEREHGDKRAETGRKA